MCDGGVVVVVATLLGMCGGEVVVGVCHCLVLVFVCYWWLR